MADSCSLCAASAAAETSVQSLPAGAADDEKPQKPRNSTSGEPGTPRREAATFQTITGEEAEKLKAKHTENDPKTAPEMIANTQELPRSFKLGTKVVHDSKGLGVIVFLQEEFPPKVFVQFPCTCKPIRCDGKKHMHGYKATSWHKLSPQTGHGWSRLASLVQGGQVKAVRKLVRDAQADELGDKQLQAWLKEVDLIGYTVLHWAISEGSLASKTRTHLTQLMLEAKADPNAATPSGNTPLMLASRHAQPALVRMLLEHGAETGVNARNASGASALHAAANSASPDCVRLLIEAGSDLKRQLHGRRPLQLSRQRAAHLRAAAAEAAADYALRKRRGQISPIDEPKELHVVQAAPHRQTEWPSWWGGPHTHTHTHTRLVAGSSLGLHRKAPGCPPSTTDRSSSVAVALRAQDAEALAHGAEQCEEQLRIAWRKLKRAESGDGADGSKSGGLGDAAGELLGAAVAQSRRSITDTAHALEDTAHAAVSGVTSGVASGASGAAAAWRRAAVTSGAAAAWRGAVGGAAGAPAAPAPAGDGSGAGGAADGAQRDDGGGGKEDGPPKHALAAPGSGGGGGATALWRLVAWPGRVTPCLAWGRERDKRARAETYSYGVT